MSARADAKLDVSVEDILLHLAGDESDLTEDEILYGPLDLVKDSLARKGLADLEIDFAAVMAGTNTQGAVASAAAPTPLGEGSIRARRAAASAEGQARAAATLRCRHSPPKPLGSPHHGAAFRRDRLGG